MEEFKLDPAVAAPYLKTLEGAKLFDRINALLRRSNITSDKKLLISSLLDTAYTLEGYARRCEQGGEIFVIFFGNVRHIIHTFSHIANMFSKSQR